MPYDLFISYSRADNGEGQITEFIGQISADFTQFAGRPLQVFFDIQDIKGMEDWRHKILQGLHSSRLLLACLSPKYLDSSYCQWEFNEYIKQEVGKAYFGDGVAPIYFVEVPGWTDKDFDRKCAAWVGELRRRQLFDLRPWFYAGRNLLREGSVQVQLERLSAQIRERISRGARAERSLGNVDAHNPHFVGRLLELRRLRETVALRQVGVLTAVHGLGGIGKTALAIEYAHAFSHEYGGGRWQIRCEGQEDLRTAVAQLAAPLEIKFTDAEKLDLDQQLARVLGRLRQLADMHEPHRCLLLLDNVDRPKLLEPAQLQRLPISEWLHVIATSRLGEAELFSRHQDRAFVPLDEIAESDAVELIQSYQPNAQFASDAERAAAHEIARLLGGLTIAVEAAAVYLGELSDSVTCADFLSRLSREGLRGLDLASNTSGEAIRHGEKRVSATLAPILDRLGPEELLVLSYASLLPADQIALPWLRSLLAERFPDFGRDAEPGYPDSWLDLLRRLFSLRLLRPGELKDSSALPTVGRIHRLIQQVCVDRMTRDVDEVTVRLISFATSRLETAFNRTIVSETRVSSDLNSLLFEDLYVLSTSRRSGPELEHWEIGCILAFAYKLMVEGQDRAGFTLAYGVAAPFVLNTLASTLSPAFQVADQLARKGQQKYYFFRKVSAVTSAVATAALAAGVSNVPFAIYVSIIAASVSWISLILMKRHRSRWLLNRHKAECYQRQELRAVCDLALWRGDTQGWRLSVVKEIERITRLEHRDIGVKMRDWPVASQASEISYDVLPNRLLEYVLESYKRKRLGSILEYYRRFAYRYRAESQPLKLGVRCLYVCAVLVAVGYITFLVATTDAYSILQKLGMSFVVFVAAFPVLRNLIGDVRHTLKAKELAHVVEHTVDNLRELENSLAQVNFQRNNKMVLDTLLACERLLDVDHWNWLRWSLLYD